MPICDIDECDEILRVEGPQTVEELEAEMAHVNQLMDRLATHRSHLRRRINSLAPISRLPPELLIEVLRRACTLHSIITPLSVGSICAEWRSLTWATPTLWTNITLQVSHTISHAHLEAKLHLLLQWLDRTATLPLDITIFTTDEDEFTFCALDRIMGVLVERSEYWGSIECLLPPQCHPSLLCRRFPLLRRVAFRPPIGSIPTFNHSPDVFDGQTAPNLCEVDLSGYNFSGMDLPWDQLKQFKSQFLTVTECWELLKRCPRLERCELDHIYCSYNHHDTSSPVQLEKDTLVHHNLQVLEVVSIKGAATSLLNAVSLPSLKELGMHDAGSDLVPLLPIVSPQSCLAPTCGLRKLSITRSVFGEEDLLGCLQALPGLEELDLRMRQMVPTNLLTLANQGMAESFVRQLFPPDGKGGSSDPLVLLPRLKKLDFVGGLYCSVDLVRDMLRWRAARRVGDGTGVARLEQATFTLVDAPWLKSLDEDAQTLGQLREEGLNIRVLLAPTTA